MKAHTIGFDSLITEDRFRPEQIKNAKFAQQHGDPDNLDNHEFKVLMDEIAKSGLQYAITSYFGTDRALDLIAKFVGMDAVYDIRKWLVLNERIHNRLPIPKYD